MKFIPKEDLIKLISLRKWDNGIVSEFAINDMFQEYGDTYYIEGGSWGYWEKTVDNVRRKELLKDV